MRKLTIAIITFCIFSLSHSADYNPPERIMVVRPTFEENTERPLRYRPDQTDFVIENGVEYYNRPLYGGNSAFRVDAGDKPEFSLYLPGHGGNMRFGIRTADGAKWLNDADRIISRYRPGSMHYVIHDKLLKDSVLNLSVIGLYDADGLIVQVELQGHDHSIDFITAYGGAGGRRGKRGGDMGCESQPIREFFKLVPQNCRDNAFTVEDNTFLLQSKVADFEGIFPENAELAITNAEKWDTLNELLALSGDPTDFPVLIATIPLTAGQPVYSLLKRTDDRKELNDEALPGLYQAAEQQRRRIAQRVTVDTPDPYINAAAAALCIAADAIWDENQDSVMHGAVAWRSKYLGWRGPYANDALGWHDRAKKHLTYWAGQQNTNQIPDSPQGGDAESNYARSHSSKQTNGDIGGKHYDMNLVYMDALFRHILWTGDLDLAAELWPVIERHIAWERRLFRRPFGDDKLPLYEAYAAIWASDDLQYHGGGVTHASAYNYYHNRLLARLAKALGKDPTPYEQEADRIRKGMEKYLWLQDRGWYAEFKDLLGLQNPHPNAALWTFYHTLDSEAADPLQAWQMSRFVDTQIPHIPVYGGDIPKGRYYTLPTTTWMPYTWSTNNVVMAEVAHTSLACWQAQRPQKAFALFKGCLLDSMFMGRCPGNAGMTTYFDMARGEAQRDFGDAVGTCSRALVEGLFGIRPDLVAGQLTIKPGFPADWDHAVFRHPDLEFDYQRTGQTEVYKIKPRFAKPLSLRMRVPAQTTMVRAVTVNGKQTPWTNLEQAVAAPAIQIDANAVPAYRVEITWTGLKPAEIRENPIAAEGASFKVQCPDARIETMSDPQNALADINTTAHTIQGKAAGVLGNRTVFAELSQGQMTWLEPIEFEIRKPYEVIAASQQDSHSLAFRIRNNTAQEMDTEAEIRVQNHAENIPLQIPAYEQSEVITVSGTDFPLLPGSNRIRVDLGEGKGCEGIVTNWHIEADNLPERSEPVSLEGIYNDRVTQIFKNDYLSPRSPYCSLAIPKPGIGSWCNFAKTFQVDDSGLRSAARQHAGRFIMPQGVAFDIPVSPQADNIVFTSQWDNYPDEITIELTGKARHIYLLMAGSTNSMQSRFDNGEVIVSYKDGSTERLALHNPTTWWPIDQDYFIDDYGFKRPEPIPPRVDLKTGRVRILTPSGFQGQGGTIPGGAALVLDLPLDSAKDLKDLHVRALANEVIIGLMSATLVR